MSLCFNELPQRIKNILLLVGKMYGEDGTMKPMLPNNIYEWAKNDASIIAMYVFHGNTFWSDQKLDLSAWIKALKRYSMTLDNEIMTELMPLALGCKETIK